MSWKAYISALLLLYYIVHISISLSLLISSSLLLSLSVLLLSCHVVGTDEAVVLIMAMRNSNMPKFLVNDAVLFSAIVSDLFPGIEVPEHVSCAFLPTYCLQCFEIPIVAHPFLLHVFWCCVYRTLLQLPSALSTFTPRICMCTSLIVNCLCFVKWHAPVMVMSASHTVVVLCSTM